MADNVVLIEGDRSDAKVVQSSPLSQSVFTDPKEYLQILKSNFAQIDTDHSGVLSLAELEQFAKNTADQRAAAAAQMAAAHFESLSKISGSLPWRALHSTGGRKGLNEDDLQLAADIADNKPGTYVDNEVNKLQHRLHWDEGLAVGWTALTAFQVFTGVGALPGYLNGALIAAKVLDAFEDSYEISHDPEKIATVFEKTQALMRSWSK